MTFWRELYSHNALLQLFLIFRRLIYFLGGLVIKCHLSRLMGERKLKIADLARETGINRGTVTRLYFETAERVELEVIDILCKYFQCAVSDLFEHLPDAGE